jgi:hypothetical protein
MIDITAANPNRFQETVSKINWTNPITWLSVFILPFGIYALSYTINTAIFLGVLMALSILTLYNKTPLFFKRFWKRHQLLCDLLFTGMATAGAAAIMGGGLTLAISFLLCDQILTFSIPRMK